MWKRFGVIKLAVLFGIALLVSDRERTEAYNLAQGPPMAYGAYPFYSVPPYPPTPYPYGYPAYSNPYSSYGMPFRTHPYGFRRGQANPTMNSSGGAAWKKEKKALEEEKKELEEEKKALLEERVE